jgi:glycosyltransferase involved in cell wall biosynthesis
MKKYILIIRQSEPLEIDNAKIRLWRASTIHEFCNKTGERAIYLTSTFDHYSKEQRKDKGRVLINAKEFFLLRTPGYKKNISLARVADSFIFGAKVALYIIRERKKIKSIFCSYPTIESSLVSVFLGRIFKIKTIIDVRDLWPDLFMDVITDNPLKKFTLRLLLTPYFLFKYVIFYFAEYVSAPTESFLQWTYNDNPSKFRKKNIKLPFAYIRGKDSIAPKNLTRFESYKKCVFIGTLSEKMFDFIPLKSAIDRFDKTVVFIIVGKGPAEKFLKSYFKNNSNVIFMGWLDKSEITGVMRYCDFAIAPYTLIENFEKNIPNKIIEYLSEGLPIIYSPKGEIDHLLKDCGIKYNPENSGYGLTFEQSIENLCNNDIMLEEMSYNAQQVFSELEAEIVYNKFIITHLS